MTKKTKIYYSRNHHVSDPILLVGLPGIGNIGSLVGEHIKNELKAKKFAVLYSPSFPHQVIMGKSGSMRMVSNRFYHFKNKKGRSIVVLVGDAQASSPRGQYEVNEKIVRFFKRLGGKTIYSVGGYNGTGQYVPQPRVFGVSNNKKLMHALEKNGVRFGEVVGTIWGSAGLIPAMAKRHGIGGACIMGETGMLEIDANAAKAVIMVLEKVLDIDVNLENIDKIKKETEKLLKDLESVSKNMQENQGSGPRGGETLSYIR